MVFVYKLKLNNAVQMYSSVVVLKFFKIPLTYTGVNLPFFSTLSSEKEIYEQKKHI